MESMALEKVREIREEIEEKVRKLINEIGIGTF
jgi:hypothetical protein